MGLTSQNITRQLGEMLYFIFILFFLSCAGERKREKGSHNGVLINTYNSNVLHALTGKPIERVL